MRRYYIENGDVEGATEEQIEMAEDMIDGFVGTQDKFFPIVRTSEVSSVSGKTIYADVAGSPLSVSDGYYTDCIIEIIGGTGTGQKRYIESSSQADRSVTYRGETFYPNVDTTSVFKIYQHAKFPRIKDAHVYLNAWYKTIPQAVKDATIAQVKFIMNLGEDYFITDDSSDKQSETIGNYSYSKFSNSATSNVRALSPRARQILKGIKTNTANLIRENQTWL